MSKHDKLYIEKFQPRHGGDISASKRTYLLARGSEPIARDGVIGVDFDEVFEGVFVGQVDKKKGPESCDSDPYKNPPIPRLF